MLWVGLRVSFAFACRSPNYKGKDRRFLAFGGRFPQLSTGWQGRHGIMGQWGMRVKGTGWAEASEVIL